MNRKAEIDILKCIAAFLIVCIHAPFQVEIGEYIVSICRIGVPIFFLITGYFYDSVVERDNEIKQIKKVFWLIVYANGLYLCWKLCMAINSGKGLVGYFKEIISYDAIKIAVFFNDSPFNGHLWYLGALLYALIIIYVFNRFNILRILFYITPLLLIVDLMFGKYSIVIFGREFSIFYVRNFLFVGIPYIIIGMLLRQRVEEKSNFYKRLSILGVFLFSMSTILERYILERNELNATRDHYISTTLLAISVFILFLNEIQTRTKISGAMAKIGRDYSLGIYVIHPIIMTLIGKVIKSINMYQYYVIIRPIIIYVVSVIVVLMIHKILLRIKR